LTAPTIRFYEQEGLLDSRHVQRTESNFRDYCEAAVEQLLMIKEVQAAGFTLAEFKDLDAVCNADGVGSSQARVLLQRKIVEISNKIAELEHVQTYLTGKLREMHQREDVSAHGSIPAPILDP
jgi:DNA-binding transcriptional MerR regulator